MKRVLAWILLVGFIFLLVNIFTFKFLIGPSVMVYILAIVLFIFTNKPYNSKSNEAEKDKV
ncbi:hypothetical protein EHE19_011445 [Ruminiclostridium herbifermentans]|uniref:Uncharacterized protein n=1 Tax=Ruminiclostridium herbifermentans TaxID=2488810 RepID=A0A4U7JHY7_9FIRM|nr:hypothetical protein [Ruminiclostridium herbifermentans]QNU65542.1 hypothetical protein EHE19_011445 [Ruminiclostridium herbifermentans]